MNFKSFSFFAYVFVFCLTSSHLMSTNGSRESFQTLMYDVDGKACYNITHKQQFIDQMNASDKKKKNPFSSHKNDITKGEGSRCVSIHINNFLTTSLKLSDQGVGVYRGKVVKECSPPQLIKGTQSIMFKVSCHRGIFSNGGPMGNIMYFPLATKDYVLLNWQFDSSKKKNSYVSYTTTLSDVYLGLNQERVVMTIGKTRDPRYYPFEIIEF